MEVVATLPQLWGDWQCLGILVKLVTLRLLRFTGVSEREFNSIFRRSLLIKFKAQFVDKHWIDQNVQDAHLYGIFPRRDDLKEMLTSSVGALCGLRIQHAFEQQHSR